MIGDLNLSTRLKSRISNMSSINPNWVLFVKDHRSVILENSQQRFIHHENSSRYKYSIYEYLNSLRTDYGQLAWIVFWLNQLDTSQDFNENITYLYLPDINYLNKLRKSFITSETLFKSK